MSAQSDTNRRVYASRRLVSGYAQRPLSPAERGILDELRPALAGKRALELGCGAGALTRELLQATDDVVGVDISPAMVEFCRSALPGGRFLVGELGDLSGHADGAYDVVVAGANVLDVVAHEDRPRVLAEIRRVLAADGLLYFSTHNRNSVEALRQAQHGPTLRLVRSPYRQLRSLASYAVGTVNHRRLARHQVLDPDYAILNDSAHRWSLLHHYITRDAESRELAACGFEVVSVRGTDGVVLGAGDDDARFTELHYLARAA